MGNLLRYNLRKLSREKSFYITLGINLALIMLSVLVMVVRKHMYTSDYFGINVYNYTLTR